MLEKFALVLAGYVLGNPPARKFINNMATKGIQMGIDTLNNKPMTPVDPIEKIQE